MTLLSPQHATEASRPPLPLASIAALAIGVALVAQAYAVADRSSGHLHFAVWWLGFGTVLLATVVLALRARSDRVRLVVLVAYGVVTFVPKLLMTPTGPRYFDEYGHWRHANDIVDAVRVFVPTPYLPIQEHYPGLEGITALLHWVTRIPTWHVGQAVVLAAHCGVLLAVWHAARQLDLSRRAASIAAVVYSLNSSYLYFDTQYSYESLGLPLAFTAVTLTIASRRAVEARRAVALAGLALLAAAATVVTHHISTVVMVAVLVVVASMVPRRDAAATVGVARSAPWLVVGLTVVGAIAWVAIAARPTYDYLEPHLRSGVVDAANFLRGKTERSIAGREIATRRTLFAGTLLPVYEIACAFLAPLLVLGAVGAVLRSIRRDVARLKLLAPFLVLVLLYVASLPLVLTASGSETAHRAWGFGYFGIAIVVASGEPLWDRLSSRLPWRRLVALAAGALVVVAIGNTAAGENVFYRFPGPAVFGSDTRSRTAETDDLMAWLRENVPEGDKVITDRFTNEAVVGYTKLTVPEPADYLVYRIYREGGEPTPRLRSYLDDQGFDWFILDRRILDPDEEPKQKLFPGYIGDESISRPALRAAGDTPFLRSVLRTDTYEVFRIRA